MDTSHCARNDMTGAIALCLPRKSRLLRARDAAVRGKGSQLLFGQRTKLVGNKAGYPQSDRPVSDRLPSEAAADRVDSVVDQPTRHTPPGAGTALLIFEPKR